MQVIEQEFREMVPGYTERECILKRCFWINNGNFYVY